MGKITCLIHVKTAACGPHMENHWLVTNQWK